MKIAVVVALLFAGRLAAQESMVRIQPAPVDAFVSVPLSRAGDAEPVPAPGTRSHALVGAAVGFGIGAVGTLVLIHNGASTAPCDRERNQDAMTMGECAALAGLGGLAGAAVGALIGHFVRSDQRSLVPRGRTHLSVVPSPDGAMSVGLSIPGR